MGKMWLRGEPPLKIVTSKVPWKKLVIGKTGEYFATIT
jgi:hypothetical protein